MRENQDGRTMIKGLPSVVTEILVFIFSEVKRFAHSLEVGEWVTLARVWRTTCRRKHKDVIHAASRRSPCLVGMDSAVCRPGTGTKLVWIV